MWVISHTTSMQRFPRGIICRDSRALTLQILEVYCSTGYCSTVVLSFFIYFNMDVRLIMDKIEKLPTCLLKTPRRALLFWKVYIHTMDLSNIKGWACPLSLCIMGLCYILWKRGSSLLSLFKSTFFIVKSDKYFSRLAGHPWIKFW